MGNSRFTREEAKRLVGERFEFGGFAISLGNALELKVGEISDGGWSVTYPFGYDAWDLLVYWMLNWDRKECLSCLENFVKLVLYPVSTRVADIDGEYLNDLVQAQTSLNDRVAERIPQPGEDEERELLEKMREQIKSERK